MNAAQPCQRPKDCSHDDHFDLQLDGVHIRLRAVQPDDRTRFAKGFEELSDEARYCRCFTHREHLTSDELDMLCNVDGVEHVALVALSMDDCGLEHESIGGARFIQLGSDAEEAEMAFLVTDAWQGRRLGQQLLVTLINIAQSRSVQRLRCHLLPGNTKARRLLLRVAQVTGWTLQFDEDGCMLRAASLKCIEGGLPDH